MRTETTQAEPGRVGRPFLYDHRLHNLRPFRNLLAYGKGHTIRLRKKAAQEGTVARQGIWFIGPMVHDDGRQVD